MPPPRTLPNPENASLLELQVAVKCAPTQRSSGRMMAIKALLMGIDFDVVAELHGMSPRTLQRWVSAFNECGIDGLIEKYHSGRPPKIPAEKTHHITDIVKHPEKVNEVHWTGRKLHGYLRRELDLEVGYSTLMRFLRDQRFRFKVPRPWPDRQDPALRAAFCERLKTMIGDGDVDLWFGDESGFEADPRPKKRLIQIGEKARITRNGDHVRMNVCGIICPRTGQAFLCEFTHSDTDSFQAFLDEANRHVAFERKRQLLILDNASWHKAKSLEWGRFVPVYLPPYSPDLNPIERLWLLIKREWFTDYYAKTREQLIDRLDQALLWAIARGEKNSKTCSIKTKI